MMLYRASLNLAISCVFARSDMSVESMCACLITNNIVDSRPGG